MSRIQPPPANDVRSVYGLGLASDIPLPELPPASQPADVTIRRGSVPEALDQPTWSGVLFEADIGNYLFKLDRLAGVRFLVRNGNEVVVDQRPDADPDTVRVFLLSSGLAAILHQRGVFPYHASAIETPYGAVLFAGPSGVGKTSLTQAFLARGYRLVSDDLSPLDFIGAGITVRPGPSRLKLKSDVLPKGADTAFRRVRPGLDKYLVPLPPDHHCGQPLPVAAIYLLSTGPVTATCLTPVSGLDRIGMLVDHQYGVTSLAMAAAHGNAYLIRLTAALAPVRMVSVCRPWSTPIEPVDARTAVGVSVAALADAIEADFSR